MCGTREAARVDPGASWVPNDACTLPAPDRPARLAEFDGLFRAARRIERPAPTRLRVTVAESGGVAEQARELAARESECCTFFAFSVSTVDDAVLIDVEVPVGRTAVLDGIAAQARRARGAAAPSGTSRGRCGADG